VFELVYLAFTLSACSARKVTKRERAVFDYRAVVWTCSVFDDWNACKHRAATLIDTGDDVLLEECKGYITECSNTHCKAAHHPYLLACTRDGVP